MRSKPADLFVALSSKNVTLVRNVLDNGGDVNCIMRLTTPLHFAISHRLIEIANLLVSRGADVNVRGTNDKRILEPALVAACRMNLQSIVDILLDSKDLDINRVDFFGYGALYYACEWGHEDLVIRLLDKGANVNISTSMGNNVLLSSCRHCFRMKRGINIAKILIQRGLHVDSHLLTSMVHHNYFDVFPLAVAANCHKHNGACVANVELWKKLRFSNLEFDRWFQDNSHIFPTNPRSLKASCVSVIRFILTQNENNISQPILDKLSVPNHVKKQILLLF